MYMGALCYLCSFPVNSVLLQNKKFIRRNVAYLLKNILWLLIWFTIKADILTLAYKTLHDLVSYYLPTSALCMLSLHSVSAILASLFLKYFKPTSALGPLRWLLHLLGMLFPRHPHNWSLCMCSGITFSVKPTSTYLKLQLCNYPCFPHWPLYSQLSLSCLLLLL